MRRDSRSSRARVSVKARLLSGLFKVSVVVGPGVVHVAKHELADDLRGYGFRRNEQPVPLEALE